MLLFSEKSSQKIFHSKCTSAAPKVGENHDKELLSTSAARYIAWIMSPVSKSNQDLVVDFLTKISESWALKQFAVVMHNKEAATFKKKLKKPKVHDKEDYARAKEYSYENIGIWLNEIETIYLQYANKTINSSASADSNAANVLSQRQNVLLRRIPLGILIGCPNCITDDGCELLLHYAATGRIFQPRGTMNAGLSRHVKQNSEWHELTTLMEKCSKRDVIAGACLVFSLTDAAESISASLFETEESGLDFIYQVKLKAGKYLMKCIKRLNQLDIDKDGDFMLRDLCNRLRHWKHQGQEVLQHEKDIDDVISDLSQKLHS